MCLGVTVSVYVHTCIYMLYISPFPKAVIQEAMGEVQTKHTYRTYNILLMMRILIELPMECVLQ